jgi:hypothetical protein
MPTNRFDRTSFDPASEEESSRVNGAAKGPDAFRQFQLQLEELGEYARLYASAKRDALTSVVRRAAMWAAVAALAGSIAVATVITATVLAMIGLSQLLGQLLGDRPWAGYLVVGGGLLLVLAITTFAVMKSLDSKFRKQTVQKYERRHQAQRTRFGHDATGRPRSHS